MFLSEVVLYVGYVVINGAIQASINKNMKLFFHFIVSVFVCHFSYAVGTLVGTVESRTLAKNSTTIHTF
jgi:hypothetical protein